MPAPAARGVRSPPTMFVPSPRSWAERTRTTRGCGRVRLRRRNGCGAAWAHPSRDLPGGVRESEARIAGEPQRHGNLALGAGLGRHDAVEHHLEPGRAHPLLDRLGRKTEAKMRVLLAQE